MSVILYNPEKFLKIAKSLKSYKTSGVQYKTNIHCWAHVFGYPDGWVEGTETLEHKIDAFVSDLYRANQQTWIRQYEDDAFNANERLRLETLPAANNEIPYETKQALYKALRSIEYNIHDNAGNVSSLNGCNERLKRIISYIADDIISATKEYEAANVWRGATFEVADKFLKLFSLK